MLRKLALAVLFVTLGAVTAFLLARQFGRPLLRRWLAGQYLSLLLGWMF